MAYKMLVLDLDGTLTNSKKEITPVTHAALDRAMEKGVKVVLASGRPTYGIVPLAKELDLARKGGYILSFNGGRITDCTTGEVIYERILSAEKAGELYDLAQLHKVNIMTYQDENIITEKPDDQYVELESRINKMTIKKVESFKDYVTFPVNKCLMVEEGDYLGEVEKKVKAAVGDELSVCRSEAFFLEVMPKNIDKAYSLGKLLEHLGMTREEMICCGDGFNDKSMIEYAGLGVAMQNGKPEVKAAADYIAPSNDEDGIAHVIEKFLL
ncbi:MAG: Cof-type HAD-IIB family hydrolase [Oscillospiraceae bacterium]|jgi:Cof subfamily protein (haloacid dehalogenase superfamily)|nr:Cof-type HAD-IIB family hydrolase [Oscillospiraceae bacterium]MDY4192481.1 Cof-type HAD-IIB family hydrolase [Oscillospiraceae bacterium]